MGDDIIRAIKKLKSIHGFKPGAIPRKKVEPGQDRTRQDNKKHKSVIIHTFVANGP